MALSEIKIIAKTDSDHVNNVKYLEYFEKAREELYLFCHSIGTRLMMANINANYKNEVFDNEAITIRTTIERIGNTSFTLKQTIEKDNNELAVSANVTFVTVTIDTKQKMTVPQEIRNLANKNRELAETL